MEKAADNHIDTNTVYQHQIYHKIIINPKNNIEKSRKDNELQPSLKVLRASRTLDFLIRRWSFQRKTSCYSTNSSYSGIRLITLGSYWNCKNETLSLQFHILKITDNDIENKVNSYRTS